MRLTPDEIEHVALLGRLRLTEEEKGRLGAQLSLILEHFEQLSELEVEGVPPTSHVIPMQNVLREDTPAASLAPEEALANAPDEGEGAFRVPRVVE